MKSEESSGPIVREALILVGHGTRSERGRRAFQATVFQVRSQLANCIVEDAYLEMCEPSIADAVQAAVSRSAARLRAVPVLLFAAGHVRRDIPRQLAAATSDLADMEWCVAPPLECHPRIIDLSWLRFDEAIRSLPEVSAEETLLLLAGRGSRDETANAEMARFARLRYDRSAAGWLETAFISMAEPPLERALAMVSRLPFLRIVVQPHLLYAGELLKRTAIMVEEAAIAWPEKEWVLTAPLGPHPWVAEALCERAGVGAGVR